MRDNQWGQISTYGASSGDAAELLRSRRRIRDQHHRHAAPRGALADRPDSGPTRLRGVLVPRRLDGGRGGRVRERPADRRVCHRTVGGEPRAVQRPAAAESHRRSRSSRRATISIASRRPITRPPPGSTRPGMPIPVSARSATRRAPTATTAIRSAGTSTSCSPRTCRFEHADGRGPLRVPEPDEHAQVRRRQHRHQQQRVRADHDDAGFSRIMQLSFRYKF